MSFTPTGEATTVTFSTPYTITSEGIYVGYSFQVDSLTSDNKTPLVVVKGSDAENFYLHTSRTYTKWASRVSTLEINSALMVHIFGIAADDAGIGALEDANTQINTPTSFTFPVLNHGTNGVQSVDYTWSVNGQTGTNHADLSIDAFYNKSADVTFQLPNFEDAGGYPLNVKLTAVNGISLTKTAEAEGNVNVYSLLPVHRPLLEEYTGTWCGYCPRGFVGLERMTQLLGDNFIGISFHNSDAMEVTTTFAEDVEGFPDAWIDRYFETDAYYGSSTDGFGIDKVYAEFGKILSPANIDLAVKWTDDAQTAVTVTSSVTFALDQSSNHWRVAYFLVADSLHGSTSDWRQHSYYAGGTDLADDSLMTPFIENEYSYPYFSDVVIGLSKNWIAGEPGSIVSPIVGDEPQTFSYTFDLSDAVNTSGVSLVQDKSKLRVVAILIDTETGHVINANKAHIGADHADKVNTVSVSSPLTVAKTYYSIDGRRLNTLQKGLNIVKTSDGKVFKVLNKK